MVLNPSVPLSVSARPTRNAYKHARASRLCAQSIGVVANPVAFWGQRPWFESRMDYFSAVSAH